MKCPACEYLKELCKQKHCLNKPELSESTEAAGYLPNGKPVDPLEMLKEIEAYLTFRLMTDEPTVPADDMRKMKTDIADALRTNGIEVNYQGR